MATSATPGTPTPTTHGGATFFDTTPRWAALRAMLDASSWALSATLSDATGRGDDRGGPLVHDHAVPPASGGTHHASPEPLHGGYAGSGAGASGGGVAAAAGGDGKAAGGDGVTAAATPPPRAVDGACRVLEPCVVRPPLPRPPTVPTAQPRWPSTASATSDGLQSTPADSRHGPLPPPRRSSEGVEGVEGSGGGGEAPCDVTSPHRVTDGGKDLATLLRTRLKNWRHWVAKQQLESHADIPSFEAMVARPCASEPSILRDAGRTFYAFQATDSVAMSPRGPSPTTRVLRESLTRVLCAVVNATKHGYCQGLNLVTGLLLTETDEVTAFWVAVRVLLHHNVLCLYSDSHPFLSDYAFVPGLCQHFVEQGFLTTMYAIEWFTTLFALSLPPEVAAAVLDLVLAGFDNVLFRVGAAVLILLEKDLIVMGTERLMMAVLLTTLCLPARPDVLVSWITLGYTPFHADVELNQPGLSRAVLGSCSDDDDDDDDRSVRIQVGGSAGGADARRGSMSSVLSDGSGVVPPCCGRRHGISLSLPNAFVGDEHTTYELRVSTPATVPVVLIRRYSDFHRLFTALRNTPRHKLPPLRNDTAKPQFPPKKWLGASNPDFVERRRRALNNYLTQLCCAYGPALLQLSPVRSLIGTPLPPRYSDTPPDSPGRTLSASMLS